MSPKKANISENETIGHLMKNKTDIKISLILNGNF